MKNLPPRSSHDRPSIPKPGGKPDGVLVGTFGAPHGVRGEIRIKSFTADPLAVGAYGTLTDESGRRAFSIESLRPVRDDLLVATVAEVRDRDMAAALTGVNLYARRENLPPPDADEVYVADLIGIAATDEGGALVGTIVGVPNFGAGDILEIAPAGGGDTLLVPFTKAFVPVVDLAQGRVVVIVPREDGGDDA